MLKAYFKKGIIEAGCDEAGRGCLAGPVFAAAVILPHDYKNKSLNDSKKLSESERYRLRKEIEESSLAFAVGIVTHQEIDEINILNASFLAMHRDLDQLKINPESLIIDGNRFNKYKNTPHYCIIKGDAKYLAIAAASVLAKTYRDDFMMKIHSEFPQYCWDRNKGYPTKLHRTAIREYGSTPYHRMSFTLLPPQYELDLD